MSTRARRPLAAIALLLAIGPAHGAGPASPVGRWLTQTGTGVVDIGPCGGGASLCGRIVGVTLDHPTDRTPTDYQGHPQCMLTILRDVLPDGTGWMGQIEDPRDGTTYDVRLRIDEQHRLRLRGYVGIPLFGRTQVWTPYAGSIPADCRLPAKPS